MAAKPPARKPPKPKVGQKGTGASAPKLPVRQDLGLGNLTSQHIAAMRRFPQPAQRDDGLGSARTGRTQGTARNAPRRRSRTAG